MRRQLDEFDGKIESPRTQHEPAGFEGDMAKHELRPDTDSVDVRMRRAAYDERIVVAVKNDDGANAQERIHGERLGSSKADGNESLPAAATHGTANTQIFEPATRQLQGIAGGAHRNHWGSHGRALRDDRDDVHRALGSSFLGNGAAMRRAGQILHAECLRQQNTIKCRQAETATAVQEIRDVRLSQAGLAREQRRGQNTHINPAPYLEPQGVV